MNILKKLRLLEEEADKFGFCWENTDQIMAQIKSECDEISEQLQPQAQGSNQASLQEEIGDLLHAVFSLCIFTQLNPEATLEKSILKFERRLHAVKHFANQRGLATLHGCSFSELMDLWNQAKHSVA